jgi:hypothetical protein
MGGPCCGGAERPGAIVDAGDLILLIACAVNWKLDAVRVGMVVLKGQN